MHLCVELGQRVHGVLATKILLHYVFGSIMVSLFFWVAHVVSGGTICHRQ